MALQSRHCRITAGLASLDMPLLVSSVESQLWKFCSWLYRASWLAQGCIPCFAYCPTSSVLKRSSFGFSASSFALSLRDGVTLPGRVSQSSIGMKALPPPSWCMVRVFAMGSPCRVGVCPRSRSERRLFGAPSLVVGVLPSQWGHPFRVGWRFSAPSIGTKASSIHLSLVASRWGHPAGRVCGFPHSIVTKPALVSCLVFLQDGVPLSGLDL